MIAGLVLSTNISAETDEDKKRVALEKIDKITSHFMEKALGSEKEIVELDKIIIDLEADLKDLEVAAEEIEVRKNLIRELYVDLADTKNLYLLEFDANGNVKKEVRNAVLTVQESLGKDAKVVKVKLANGKFLPLIKYKVKKNDTLKKITLNTYPIDYSPSWKEISKRIETLVNINKNIIKMNYIYPDQIIYVPLFKDNPNKQEVKERILKNKQKQLKKQNTI